VECTLRKVPSATHQIRLAQLREGRGLKRHELAIEFGVDPSSIWRWERSGPPKEMLPRVAEFFGVSVEHLMGWDGEPA
jgi:transcriptional regulator with XRE-family HTH domain